MPTVEEVLNYLGIDYIDDMVITNVNRAIKTADAYLKGSIGNDYPTDDPRAKELALIFIADLYDNREVTEKVSTKTSYNVRRLIEDFKLQLRLEMRRGTSAIR